MLTLNALRLLKYCAQHNDLKYNTHNIEIENLSNEQSRKACELLITKGYLKFEGYSINREIHFETTPKGKDYITHIKLNILEFVIRSILIPIIVAFITASFATHDTQDLNIIISSTTTPSNAIEIRSTTN